MDGQAEKSLSSHRMLVPDDTLRLLLRFASERKRRGIAELAVNDLQAAEVTAFLEPEYLNHSMYWSMNCVDWDLISDSTKSNLRLKAQSVKPKTGKNITKAVFSKTAFLFFYISLC